MNAHSKKKIFDLNANKFQHEHIQIEGPDMPRTDSEIIKIYQDKYRENQLRDKNLSERLREKFEQAQRKVERNIVNDMYENDMYKPFSPRPFRPNENAGLIINYQPGSIVSGAVEIATIPDEEEAQELCECVVCSVENLSLDDDGVCPDPICQSLKKIGGF